MEVEVEVEVEVELLELVDEVDVVTGHVLHKLWQFVLNSGMDKLLSQNRASCPHQ